jgi:hypothetical protein
MKPITGGRIAVSASSVFKSKMIHADWKTTLVFRRSVATAETFSTDGYHLSNAGDGQLRLLEPSKNYHTSATPYLAE